MPYEAQPFQNKIFSEIRIKQRKTKSIGYLHSLTPLTTELIHRDGSPDILLVHGESQINILKSRLDWPQSKLVLIDSLRFKLNKNISLSKKIFLPFSLHDSNVFIKEFEKLMQISSVNSFPHFEIKIHPGTLNMEKNLNLKHKLENVIEKYNDRFSSEAPDKSISIFFGVTTAILEALEKDVQVIHICSDPLFQSYSEIIWPNLKVKKITDFAFNYNLISKGKIISIKDNSNLLGCLRKTHILNFNSLKH